MFKKILILITIIVVAFSTIVAIQPSEFKVERSAEINAPVEETFEIVNNLKQWNSWDPWAKLDPNALSSFEGPESGQGAIMHWSGNMDVGEGTMTIMESQPNALIRLKIDFTKPFSGTNTTEFIFLSQDDGKTKVTWSMYGKNNFIGKAMGLIFNCEKMVGEQFENGLQNMQTVLTKPKE